VGGCGFEGGDLAGWGAAKRGEGPTAGTDSGVVDRRVDLGRCSRARCACRTHGLPRRRAPRLTTPEMCFSTPFAVNSISRSARRLSSVLGSPTLASCGGGGGRGGGGWGAAGGARGGAAGDETAPARRGCCAAGARCQAHSDGRTHPLAGGARALIGGLGGAGRGGGAAPGAAGGAGRQTGRRRRGRPAPGAAAACCRPLPQWTPRAAPGHPAPAPHQDALARSNERRHRVQQLLVLGCARHWVGRRCGGAGAGGQGQEEREDEEDCGPRSRGGHGSNGVNWAGGEVSRPPGIPGVPGPTPPRFSRQRQGRVALVEYSEPRHDRPPTIFAAALADPRSPAATPRASSILQRYQGPARPISPRAGGGAAAAPGTPPA
jgi:hypothetical protein